MYTFTLVDTPKGTVPEVRVNGLIEWEGPPCSEVEARRLAREKIAALVELEAIADAAFGGPPSGSS